MKLNEAKLCIQCEEIYVGNTCPSCASKVSWPLNMWVPSMKRADFKTEIKRLIDHYGRERVIEILNRVMDKENLHLGGAGSKK